MENGEITIRGLLAPRAGKKFEWKLGAGQLYLVAGSGGSPVKMMLDNLAGHRQDSRLTLVRESASGVRQMTALPSVGLLPPAGDEIYVGTTVGEQLSFFTEENISAQLEQSGLDSLFEFEFANRLDKSVWELGAGERRCLLLVSQALALPRFWVLHDPLDRMDGRREAAVKEFIQRMRGRGDTLIAGLSDPAGLLAVSSHLLVLEDGNLKVEFYGGGRQAAEYLSANSSLPLEALVNLVSGED